MRKESGVDATIIGRFLNKKQGLSFASIELLFYYFGLDVVCSLYFFLYSIQFKFGFSTQELISKQL